MSDVTIIGLGPMGFTLADLMIKAGKSVSIWNRSAGKAAALVDRGAVLAASPAEAIAASPVTIVCVFDYDAVDAVLAAEHVSNALADRLVINLGTGGPDDVRRVEAHVRGKGGRYLDGAIQAAPSQMGEDNTPLLVSGAKASFEEAFPLLKVLAGNPVYLGEEPEAAAYMDLATLSYVYGSFAGFLHGALIAEASQIDVATYARLVNAISPSFGAFFQHEGEVIASGDFRVTESPLRISVPAVRRILASSRQLGLNTEIPGVVDGWLQRADKAGLADEELAALIKVLRT
ncbi:NAD(P)-dependent oxidoreductase [Roseibium sp. M-1]